MSRAAAVESSAAAARGIHDSALQFPVMSMRFIVDETRPIRESRLVYRAKDYAFSAEPRPEDCAYAVGINELELMIDEDDQSVAFVTGYCPHPGWHAGKLNPPVAFRAVLRVEAPDAQFVPGRTLGLTSRDSRWPVVVDPRNGWICLGSPDKEGRAVEFARDCVAVLIGDALVALWLHPRELPPDVKARLPS